MKPRIYYTTNQVGGIYKVTFLDHQGQVIDYAGTVWDFEQQFPRSMYMNGKDFEARKRQAALDRAKLAQWKEWAV